jgi:cyclophilin family peptidyl-prolyl cis-trans isomerase/HEAT repeat protein
MASCARIHSPFWGGLVRPFLFRHARIKLYGKTMKRLATLYAIPLLIALPVFGLAQQRRSPATRATGIPQSVLIRILRAEDERRWDNNLSVLLADKNPKIRARVALAAGRIGDRHAIPALTATLRDDNDYKVQELAAFALGEIESPGAAYVLLDYLNTRQVPARARAVEALGKIAAAVPKGDEGHAQMMAQAILGVLRYEAARRSKPDDMTILLGLTAALRAKPEGAGPVIGEFLGYANPRIVSDALNTMARLKLKDNNEEVRQLLLKHADPIVRANAARVAGAAEDKGAFDALLDRALNDADLRVRASAIRSLGLLKDQRAIAPLLRRGQSLTPEQGFERQSSEANEVLELATTLGRLGQASDTAQTELLKWLSRTAERFGHVAPEIEIAQARISPENFAIFCSTDKNAVRMMLLNWKAADSVAQGLREMATMERMKDRKNAFAQRAMAALRSMIDYRNSGLTINTLVAVHSEYAIPNVLRAYAAFKLDDLSEVLRAHLKVSDVVVRATAAELLGELEPADVNTRALIAALAVALADRELNDAALAILDSLGKQKSAAANDAIKTALASSDHLLRRKAVALLKENGVGDFSARIGTVKTRNTDADYRRAIARIGKPVRANVETGKGSFTIEFLPDDAPLTVDNFVQLSRKGFFNGQTVPRVVPNFVVQTGDPRGDQNGGPGYQIRCEINMATYARGAVGMALSGKDTGGSQWFVTHSPQPHLDGGYTVFGRVVSGMEVVDRIVRGDVISRITVTEQR